MFDSDPEPTPVQAPEQAPTPEYDGSQPAVFPEQWERLGFFSDAVSAQSMKFCERCSETWFQEAMHRTRQNRNVAIPRHQYCDKCRLRDKGKNETDPYLMHADNNMDPGEGLPSFIQPEHDRPSFLLPLTPLEEAIIARVHVHMQIKRHRGLQFHYHGHCISFKQHTLTFVDQLPRLPSQLNILILKPPASVSGEERYIRQFSDDFTLRKPVVTAWLHYLKATDSDYADIVITEPTWIPEDGNIFNCLPSVVDPSLADPIANPTPAPNNPEFDNPHPAVEESVVLDLQSELTEIETIFEAVTNASQLPVNPPTPPDNSIFAPSIEPDPINEHQLSASNEHLFSCAFFFFSFAFPLW